MTTPGFGRLRQNAIYRAGAFGHRPTVPTDAATLEQRALARMSPRARAYVGGGAGEGATMRHNREAFDPWRIVPRMLRGAVSRDLTRTILGTRLASPLLLAPVGAARLVRRNSDVLIARGAAAAGVPYVLSCQGCNPMEETAAAMAGTPFWYQLYWSTDEPVVDSMIRRAEQCGAQAVVVTLDTTTLGWRPQDLNLGSLPFARGEGIAQYTSDPAFRELLRTQVADASGPREKVEVTLGAVRTLLAMTREFPGPFLTNLRSPEPRAAAERFVATYSKPSLSWDDIATLRRRTALPVLLKGILHPDDARRASEHVDGVIVSNHGGRQVDASIAALDALPLVRDAVGPDFPVLFDSGIRTGADVFVALALGADACLLGRPHIYGLTLAGADGVRQVIENVLAELDLTMGLTGVNDLAGITRELLVRG